MQTPVMTSAMKVFIHPTGQWTSPFMTGLAHEMVEVNDDMTLQEVADAALVKANTHLEPTWIWMVESPDSQGRQRMTSLTVVIDDAGVLRWLPEGAADVSMRELRRTHAAGLFKGDPEVICVERMLGGNGVLPGWEELFSWLIAGAGGATMKIAVDRLRAILSRHFERWKKRGAQSAYAFLDVVLARETWALPEIAQLLQIKETEAQDLLTSLGYVKTKKKGQFELSDDPDIGQLRKKILKDFLNKDPDEE